MSVPNVDDYVRIAQTFPKENRLQALAERCVDMDRALEAARAERDALRKRLNEVEAALYTIGGALNDGLDGVLKAAEAIEKS